MEDSTTTTKQHLAFQEFMLGGGGFYGKNKKKNKNNNNNNVGGSGEGGGGGGISTPSPFSSSSTKKNRNKGSRYHYHNDKGVTSPSPSPSSSIKKHQQRINNKQKKSVYPILKVIQTKLIEWNDIDEQIMAILNSISNLRFRIWIESCELSTTIEEEGNKQKHDDDDCGGDEGVGKNNNEWEGYGLRGNNIVMSNGIGTRRSSGSGSGSGSGGCVLTTNDIQLALNYDTLQHERMISGLRTMISTLSQILDSIGRRLDEWMKIQYEYDCTHGDGYEEDHDNDYDDDDDDDCTTQVAVILEMVQNGFLFLSDELYRKQVLVKTVLDTCHDGLIAPYRIIDEYCDGDYDYDSATKTTANAYSSNSNRYSNELLLLQQHDDGSSNKINPRTAARRSCNMWNKQQGDDEGGDDDTKSGASIVDELLNIGSIQDD